MTDTDDTVSASTESRDAADFKVVRAHALREGEVMYLVAEGKQRRWSHDINEATVYRETDIGQAMALAEEDMAGNLVVGAEPIEITGKHEPVGAKEAIRASGGPTIKYGEDALEPDYSI